MRKLWKFAVGMNSAQRANEKTRKVPGPAAMLVAGFFAGWG
jgi:hypothetical protein